MKIIPIDCHYVEAEFATSYLLVEKGKGFFVECNTNYAIPYLVKAVKDQGLKNTDIEGLLITHVHLDHAGGAGLFLKEFPHAKLYAHPRAAKHAIDPSRLIESATKVYGEAFMQKMYGTILPCDASRVVILNDGDSVPFQKSSFKTKWMRGHANHHLVMVEPETKTCFTGDSFGVSYPKQNVKHGLVILPSTSPTDFDGEAAIQSVKWIAAQGFEQLALTHYGFILKDQIAWASQMLIDQIQLAIHLVEETKIKKLTSDQTEDRLKVFTKEYFKSKKLTLTPEEWKHLNIDLSVNAQGLYWRAQNP